MVSYQPAKFGDRKHCGSEDIIILFCYVSSQNHVIKGSCDLPNLVVISTVVMVI